MYLLIKLEQSYQNLLFAKAYNLKKLGFAFLETNAYNLGRAECSAVW